MKIDFEKENITIGFLIASKPKGSKCYPMFINLRVGNLNQEGSFELRRKIDIKTATRLKRELDYIIQHRADKKLFCWMFGKKTEL